MLLLNCGDLLTTLTPSIVGNDNVAELIALGKVTVSKYEP